MCAISLCYQDSSLIFGLRNAVFRIVPIFVANQGSLIPTVLAALLALGGDRLRAYPRAGGPLR
jgi:hypothetical protein